MLWSIVPGAFLRTASPNVVASRRDAVRNRELLVEAGRQVFAEKGLQATLDDIAERAGVGIGTAYRHFRNKHEVAAEVLAVATESIALDAEAALLIEDPWIAIVTFVERNAARQASDRALYEVLAGQGRDADKLRLWPRIVEAVTTLFERAHQSKVIRDDARPEDVVAIFAMLGAVYDLDQHSETWRRYLALLLDGLQATNRPPLPHSSVAYGHLDDVIKAARTVSNKDNKFQAA
jgi:AcrR family transcriptional regulator